MEISDNNPIVSIITPNFNCSRFITQAIESVLAQTYKNWEMIIIDDCSTDESYKIIQEYAKKDSRIKVYRMEKNSGAAVCRNKAIEFSNGGYLAFIDSDDLWLPEKLEKQLNFMRENNCDFSFTEYEHIDENNNSLNIKAKVINKLTYKEMLFHCFTGCLTVIYKQDLKNKIYSPILKNCNDYALFLQILKNVKNAMGLNEILAKYRIIKNSLSRNKLNKIQYFIEFMIKYENKNIIIAFFYLFTNQIIKIFWKYKKIK